MNYQGEQTDQNTAIYAERQRGEHAQTIPLDTLSLDRQTHTLSQTHTHTHTNTHTLRGTNSHTQTHSQIHILYTLMNIHRQGHKHSHTNTHTLRDTRTH